MAVRKEKVLLELEDQFTSRMAKAAAATAILSRELDDLSGKAVRTDRESARAADSVERMGAEAGKSGAKVRRGAADIDRYSGRVRLLAEAAVTLGPALTPIGAVGVPAVVALAAGMGAAAGALGTLLLGFNGLGEALKTIDEYKLDPTVDNLHAMQDSLDALGPAGANFARYLTQIRPELEQLQELARQGMFPGLADGLDDLLTRLPEVEQIVSEIAHGLGELGADAGAALAGERFEAFFEYLERDAAPTMDAFARSTGNVVEGLASLLVAFAPLTRDFTGGMQDMSRSFADWAAGLSETDGFRDFTAYVRESGPQVIALLGALGNAFVAIATATAPVGAVVVPALTALARLLAVIANSPVGSPLLATAAALIVLNRAVSLGQAGFAKFSGGLDATTGGLTRMQKAAGLASAALAGLAIIDSLQGTNKAAPGINQLTNSLLALRGATEDGLPEDLDGLSGSIERLANPRWANKHIQDPIADAIGFGGGSEYENAKTQIEALDQALTQIVNNQGPEVAAQALEGLARSAELSKSELADLTGLLPGYKDAVAGAVGVTDKFAAVVRVSGRAAGLTRAELRGLTEAMEEQRQTALATFDAVTQYNRAIDEARKRAKHTEAGLDADTAAGRKNRDMLAQVAAAWNNQGEAVRNNVSKWREARQNFIETATAMGAPIEQARRLADRLLEIPRQRVIDIQLYGSEQAADEVARIKRELESIPKSIRTPYVVAQLPGDTPNFPSLEAA